MSTKPLGFRPRFKVGDEVRVHFWDHSEDGELPTDPVVWGIVTAVRAQPTPHYTIESWHYENMEGVDEGNVKKWAVLHSDLIAAGTYKLSRDPEDKG